MKLKFLKMKYEKNSYYLLILFFLGVWSCNQNPKPPSTEEVTEERSVQQDLDWEKEDVIYEVNVRQYTEEGTFNAFAEHLPRLKEMGVDILWFMPIHPISETKRKGTLGSYYAVSDFRAVNPEFGTLDDFKALVDRIHEMDMRAILDWVPGHTGWDHYWIEEHPDWYLKGEDGEITDPLNDDGTSMGWTDIADLDYSNEEMRAAMTGDMIFWLEETDIDGFRQDAAWDVPQDYWEECLPKLREINPGIFLLAEADLFPLRKSEDLFDATYAWRLHHHLNQIAQEKEEIAVIDEWYQLQQDSFKTGYTMQFITNHDENSWQGTIQERMGDAGDAMAVLTFTLEGMPLVYSGQEAALDKRLEFFEKDVIDWNGFPKQDFYTTLIELKERNSALWNGKWGAERVKIPTELDDSIYAFYRQKGEDTVIVILNLSDDQHDFTLNMEELAGEYTNVFANSTVTVGEELKMSMTPWDYLVLSNK